MSISMVKEAAAVSLEKQMKVSLDKGNDPGEIEVQMEMYIDTSTSMHSRYETRGRWGHKTPSEMQVTTTRNLALALTGLDKDQNIPVNAYDDKVRPIGTATEQNYEKLLPDWLSKNSLVPATRFMPIIEDVDRKYGGNKPDEPVVIVVHTDGVPADERQFKQAIINMAHKPIFWIFIGHGQSLGYLQDLDTMGGRVVDNVALVEVKDAADLSDVEYFDKLTHELIVDWFPAARAKGIVK